MSRAITRRVSDEVFSQISNSGFVTAMERKVLLVLHCHDEPMTSGEVATALSSKHSSISPRFAPLYQKGVIEIATVRKCSTSKRTASAWALTGNRPQRIKQKSHKKKIIEALEAYVRADPWGCYCHEGRGQCLLCHAKSAIRND